MARNTVFFVFDFIDKTISGSASTFKKANTGVGPEYDELVRKMNAHPDFNLVVSKPKEPVRAKRTYNGLTNQLITEYLSIQVEAQILKNERAEVEKWAKDTGRKTFPVVKKWFLKKFSTEESPFDVEKAKKEIFTAMSAQANKTALCLVEKKMDGNVIPISTEEATTIRQDA